MLAGKGALPQPRELGSSPKHGIILCREITLSGRGTPITFLSSKRIADEQVYKRDLASAIAVCNSIK